MTGDGPYAWMIGRRFEAHCAKLGLNETRFAAHDRAFSRSRKRRPTSEPVLTPTPLHADSLCVGLAG